MLDRASRMVHRTREHEEEIAQPVEIAHRHRAYLRLLARQHNRHPLGSATYRAPHVERGPRLRSARKNEVPQRRQILLKAVDCALKTRHVRRCNTWKCKIFHRPVRRRQIGPQHEQLLLNRGHKLLVLRKEPAGPRQPEYAVQFVDGSIALDAERVLRDTRPSEQPRGAVVAGLRIDLIGGCSFPLICTFGACLPDTPLVQR
jgi:hypothetical protein